MTPMNGGSRSTALISAAPMPPPEIYEREYKYWPWGSLINWIAGWIGKSAPFNAFIFDYMCGTGHLLSILQQLRSDVRLAGCDIHYPFVNFANRTRPRIAISHADALAFGLKERPDIITCTAGLHHLTFNDQEIFVSKLANECDKETFVLIGEEAIGEANNEQSRKLGALRLASELIVYGIKRDWPNEMIDAAVEVLKNDILLRGEYKRAAGEWKRLLEPNFKILESHWTWVAPSGGGDIVLVCKKRE